MSTVTMPEPISFRKTNTDSRTIKKVKIEWVSDASGNAAVPTTNVISGFIVGCEIIPDSGGTQPTDNYDLTLTTEDGVDILNGRGANRDNATSYFIAPGIEMHDGTTAGLAPPPYDGILTLNVAGAGDSNGGTVNLYIY